MTIYEIAKEITLAALHANVINTNVNKNDTYESMNTELGKNVAAFYNAVVKNINFNHEDN